MFGYEESMESEQQMLSISCNIVLPWIKNILRTF